MALPPIRPGGSTIKVLPYTAMISRRRPGGVRGREARATPEYSANFPAWASNVNRSRTSESIFTSPDIPSSAARFPHLLQCPAFREWCPWPVGDCALRLPR